LETLQKNLPTAALAFWPFAATFSRQIGDFLHLLASDRGTGKGSVAFGVKRLQQTQSYYRFQ
jgi:hypothetical protein